MRRLAIGFVIAAAVLGAGLVAWRAEATTLSAAARLGAAPQSLESVKNAACRGTGAHCPPGYVWNGRRCVPC